MKTRSRFTRAALSMLAVLMSAVPALGQELRTAELGTCALESGVALSPCTIAYRTLGSLDADRSNAILMPTWFQGTSEQMLGFVPTLADTSRFFVILVDALGNGVSTSPSNSPTQGGAAFPTITIGDMVASQYRLVTEALGLERLHAVTGASMGGMQTFEWLVAHPGFFEKAVPLIGSPRLGAFDIALWETELRMLDLYESCRCADAAAALAGVGMLTSSSPDAFNPGTDRTAIGASLESAAEATLARPDGWTYDMASQLRAMIAHDVTRGFGGDMARAAKAATADLLSVVVVSDHVVTPGPAIEFVDLAGGESIVVDNPGGHGGLFLPGGNWAERVRAFLGAS